MTGSTSPQRDLIEKLYIIFSKYGPENVFNCTNCYAPEEISYYQSTEVRSLPTEEARVALWETADHWDSSEAYRHFLPRLLEIMAPPDSVEDMNPTRILGTLTYHDFHLWPNEEKDAVISYLRALKPTIAFYDDAEENEWDIAFRRLIRDA